MARARRSSAIAVATPSSRRLGYRVLRITWRQLTREPEAVIALIADALSAARSA